MESTQGNLLCSYSYLKLAKTYASFSSVSYLFSSTKLENRRAEQVLWGGWEEERVPV
jgi:hypothetical protein